MSGIRVTLEGDKIFWGSLLTWPFMLPSWFSATSEPSVNRLLGAMFTLKRNGSILRAAESFWFPPSLWNPLHFSWLGTLFLPFFIQSSFFDASKPVLRMRLFSWRLTLSTTGVPWLRFSSSTWETLAFSSSVLLNSTQWFSLQCSSFSFVSDLPSIRASDVAPAKVITPIFSRALSTSRGLSYGKRWNLSKANLNELKTQLIPNSHLGTSGWQSCSILSKLDDAHFYSNTRCPTKM